MTNLFGHSTSAAKASALDLRKADVKAKLSFGEVATALRLKGSSRAGWDCPCGAPCGLKEERGHRGARCSACANGVDVIGLWMGAQRVGFVAAVRGLEDLIEARDRKAATGDDLFGER